MVDHLGTHREKRGDCESAGVLRICLSVPLCVCVCVVKLFELDLPMEEISRKHFPLLLKR